MFFFTAKKKVKNLWHNNGQLPIKVLVVRNDGLGDFILTLPLISGIKKQCDNVEVYVMINKNLTALTTILNDIDGSIIDEGILLKRHKDKFSKQELKVKRKQLLAEIQVYNFDLAILPYSEKCSAKIIKQAGIKLRAGSGRRSYSNLFNLKNFETRRSSGKSEFELNQNYLSIVKLINEYNHPTIISQVNNNIGTVTVKANPIEKQIVIHPYKRSGTALTWSLDNYVNLVKKLLQQKHKIIIIGDKEDEKILNKNFKSLKQKNNQISIRTNYSLRELVYFIARVDLYIGNSSGPLHIAGLTGTAHIGFYPKDKVSSATRWQTLPHDGTKNFLLSPRNNMQCIKCITDKCQFYNCINSIELKEVIKKVNELL